jgi:hypothetical protein
MLHDNRHKHGVVMHVDEAKADIVPTVSSIDLKTYPGSMAAIAKILNHMGASWTFRTDGFDADNVSLTAGDRAGQRTTTLGIVAGCDRLRGQNAADAGMRAFLHRNALGGGERVRQGTAVPGHADHRIPGRRLGGWPHPRQQGRRSVRPTMTPARSPAAAAPRRRRGSF